MAAACLPPGAPQRDEHCSLPPPVGRGRFRGGWAVRQGEWSGEGEKPRTVWAGVGAGGGDDLGRSLQQRQAATQRLRQGREPRSYLGGGGTIAALPPGVESQPPPLPPRWGVMESQHTPSVPPTPTGPALPSGSARASPRASTAAGAQTQHLCRAPQATALSRQHLGLGRAWVPTALLSGPPLRPLPGALLGVRPALPSPACGPLPAPRPGLSPPAWLDGMERVT